MATRESTKTVIFDEESAAIQSSNFDAAGPPPADPKPTGTRIPTLPFYINLMRFSVIIVLSWIMSYAAMSANPKWTVETYVPWSFWLLHYLLIFGIIGGGWPCVAPFGMDSCKKFWGGHGRIVLGFVMTGLVLAFSVSLSAFFVNVWWGYPLFPGGAWFGIGLFWMTLWWVLDIQTSASPLIPHHPFPPVNMALSSVICILLAVAVFQFCDYVGPWASDSSNPEGPSNAPWWFGCVVSIIVWVHNFASILVFQSWPFSLLPHPILQHAALTATTVLLGWAIYEIIIAAGVNYSFFADAIGASQISWSLFHTVAFDFWPFHNMVQPKRGIYSFMFSQVAMPFFWIWFCRIILEPIYDLMVDANPMYGAMFTLNTMIPWFTLHVMAPLLIIHHAFFMRWPLPPAGPPMGPMDKGLVQDPNEENNEADEVQTASPEEKAKLSEHTVQETTEANEQTTIVFGANSEDAASEEKEQPEANEATMFAASPEETTMIQEQAVSANQAQTTEVNEQTANLFGPDSN